VPPGYAGSGSGPGAGPGDGSGPRRLVVRQPGAGGPRPASAPAAVPARRGWRRRERRSVPHRPRAAASRDASRGRPTVPQENGSAQPGAV